MFTLLTHAVTAIVAYEFGVHGLPFIVALFKAWQNARKVSAAKAVVDKAMAAAQALVDAQALLAAQPAPAAPAPAAPAAAPTPTK